MRILVVDDEAEIVRLVKGYLEQAGHTVLTAYNGETAIQTLRREQPDLLVLDLMLPDRDGWDVTRALRADPLFEKLPIIMLTARAEDADKIIGLELGADDYMTKPFNPREVVARVKALQRRIDFEQKPVTTVLRSGALTLDLNQHQFTLDGDIIELTPTEFKLLETLMRNPGYTYSREELLEKALGYSYEGLGRTLDTHIRNLRRKIEPDTTEPTYIQTVYGIGYRFRRES